MVAFVLSLLWRQMGSVKEAVRVLNREGMLWCSPVKVSHQAMNQRLRCLPPELFEGVLGQLLPVMHTRARQRTRPLPEAVAFALKHYTQVLALDGSTLDALNKKVGLLRDTQGTPLAGRMAALLDVASRLPKKVWYEEESTAHDQCFVERALECLTAGSLILMDLGFTDYALFDTLSQRQVVFITRLKSNAAFRVVKVLREGPHVKDRIVVLGSKAKQCQALMRVVEVHYQGQWYRYLTNEIDDTKLPTQYVVGLYWQRWRIEDAYQITKRLLGLAYFAVGSINTVQVQLWATWILYSVLIDLSDAVAQELDKPMALI
jgi:hypothetical protein